MEFNKFLRVQELEGDANNGQKFFVYGSSNSPGCSCTRSSRPDMFTPNIGGMSAGDGSSFTSPNIPCDWQIAKDKIHERTQHLWETGQWSDCKFIVGTEPHQKVFEGHKLFMAMSSPVFEAMFFGGMAEKDGPIQILDVQPEGFKALMEYIYSEKVTLKSFDQACELCYVAKKYMLPHLVRKCTEYIWGDIRPDNACRAYEFAKLFEEPKLMSKSLEVIRDQTQVVLAEPSFEEVEIATVQAIFDEESLNIETELQLFDALQRWAKRECARKGLCCTDDKALRSVLHGVVGKIRFLTMSPSQFAERVAVSALLSQDEAFAILVNISSPATASQRPYPDGFTTSRQLRNRNRPPLPQPHSSHLPQPPPQSNPYFHVTAIIECAPRKMCCTRSRIPQPLDSSLTFKVNADVCIQGVTVPTQVLELQPNPPCTLGRKEPYTYSELIYAHLLDSDGSRLTYTHFSSRVRYNDVMEIVFNRLVSIQRDKIYRVGVVFNKEGSYPFGLYTDCAERDGITFDFNVKPEDSVREGLIQTIFFKRSINDC